MAWSGFPEDTTNLRTDACGCRFVRIASTPTTPEGWVRNHTCDEHKEADRG